MDFEDSTMVVKHRDQHPIMENFPENANSTRQMNRSQGVDYNLPLFLNLTDISGMNLISF